MSQCTPSASQPLPSSQSDQVQTLQDEESPLYRFAFGIHKGKTLLEVPESYLAYARMQGLVNQMLGLEEAIQAFERGQRPVAPPGKKSTSSDSMIFPICSSQPSSSSAPAAVSGYTYSTIPPPSSMPLQPYTLPTPNTSFNSQLLPSSAPASALTKSFSSQPHPSSAPQPPDTTDPQEPTVYRFDFGMHAGKTLTEVPAHYIDFLKKKDVPKDRPALAAALTSFSQSKAENAKRMNPLDYVLTFGKHEGQRLGDVPPDYVAFLRRTPDVASTKGPTLAVVLAHPALDVCDAYDNPKTNIKASSFQLPSDSTTESRFMRNGKPMWVSTW